MKSSNKKPDFNINALVAFTMAGLLVILIVLLRIYPASVGVTP